MYTLDTAYISMVYNYILKSCGITKGDTSCFQINNKLDLPHLSWLVVHTLGFNAF